MISPKEMFHRLRDPMTMSHDNIAIVKTEFETGGEKFLKGEKITLYIWEPDGVIVHKQNGSEYFIDWDVVIENCDYQ